MTAITPPIDVLIDSSFLFALHSLNDRSRELALSVAKQTIRRYVITDIVLAETAYMLRNRIHQKAVLVFLDTLYRSRMDLEAVTKPDLQRARAIMVTYSDADLNLADCCIMAQAERLGITHVCTFDERDFRLFRPSHCDYLTILPADLDKS